jgi:hypothetical protein
MKNLNGIKQNVKRCDYQMLHNKKSKSCFYGFCLKLFTPFESWGFSHLYFLLKKSYIIAEQKGKIWERQKEIYLH